MKGNLGHMRWDYADVRARYNVGDRLLPYFLTHTLEDRVGMAMALTMLTELRLGLSWRPTPWEARGGCPFPELLRHREGMVPAFLPLEAG